MFRYFPIVFSGFSFLFLLSMIGFIAKDGLPGILEGRVFSSYFWDFRSGSFNIFSMAIGTFMVSFGGALLASPIALGAAIYTSEYLSGSRRALIKIMIELLAGVPSVVYGLLGIAFILPNITPLIIAAGGDSGDSLLAGVLVLAIMILPTVMTFADDALRCVPKEMREEALGLGLSRLQVIFFVVLVKARKGLIGANMLGLGRAIGETIAIYLVIGRSDMPFSPESFSLQAFIGSGQTFTTKLGGAELAIAYGDDMHWQSLMSIALCLWFCVASLSYLSEKIIGKTQ
ncbi:MAG: phosphate ABC transporter permease subunit PstC [Oligoflexales bacterium]